MFEIREDKNQPGAWIVSDGWDEADIWFMAYFTGPCATKLAKEYCDWLNSKQEIPAAADYMDTASQ